ncbi:hypothetical protein [Lysinibacillus sp. LZ02]|uniref:hypothetical protein n=1 Tax=Lysinibacillus sp. LZ02 TaxID=3420668 RepID=UPI003D35AAA8
MSRIEDWTNILVDLGISKEHIESMKDYQMQSIARYLPYYEEQKREEKTELISTKKIKGISTGWNTSGNSIYSLFFSVTGEIKLKGEGGIHANRILENFNSLQKNGLKYQHDFYVNETLEPVLRDGLPRLQYFLDDDIYFSGATHRTICALMFNASEMVGKVKVYKKNYVKYENWLLSNDNQKVWKELLKKEFRNIFIKIESNTYNKVTRVEIHFNKPKIFLGEVQVEVRINPSGEELLDKQYFQDEKSRLKFLVKKLEELDELIGDLYSEVKLPFVYRVSLKYNLKFLYEIKLLLEENKYYFIDIRNSRNEIEGTLRKIFQRQLITEGSNIIKNKK